MVSEGLSRHSSSSFHPSSSIALSTWNTRHSRSQAALDVRRRAVAGHLQGLAVGIR